MLSHLYSGIAVRQQIIEELVRYADKELLFRHGEDVIQGYLGYVLFVLSRPEEAQQRKASSPKSEAVEEKKEPEERVAFPTETFKQIMGIAKAHMCLRTLLDIILELLRLQGICTQFGESPRVFFNEDLVSDIYRVLMSVFKDVLKKVPCCVD